MRRGTQTNQQQTLDKFVRRGKQTHRQKTFDKFVLRNKLRVNDAQFLKSCAPPTSHNTTRDEHLHCSQPTAGVKWDSP